MNGPCRHADLHPRVRVEAQIKAPSTRRLAPLPGLGRRCPAREPHGFLIEQHHHDLRTGAHFVGRHDVGETVPVVVAGDLISAWRPDVRTADLEMAAPQAPLPIDRIGARRADASHDCKVAEDQCPSHHHHRHRHEPPPAMPTPTSGCKASPLRKSGTRENTPSRPRTCPACL